MTDRINEHEKLSNAEIFNAITSGTVAKLNVLSELFSKASGFPEDADDGIVLYEAARLEEILRSQANGACECLRTLLAKNGLHTKIKELD